MSKKSFKEVMRKITEHYTSMEKEEFDALMEKGQLEMDNAIINGTEHLGLTLWYAQNPWTCKEYVDKVLAEHKKSLK